MIEIARVVSLAGNKAKVEIQSSSDCSSGCKTCKGCSAAVATVIEVDNTIGAKIGQYVKIEMKSESYYKALLLVYGFPMVMLFIGIILGTNLGGFLNSESYKELLGAGFGIFLWWGSYYITRLLDKKNNLSNKIRHVIIGTV